MDLRTDRSSNWLQVFPRALQNESFDELDLYLESKRSEVISGVVFFKLICSHQRLLPLTYKHCNFFNVMPQTASNWQRSVLKDFSLQEATDF